MNRFKKNVSLHVETTGRWTTPRRYTLWIALKKMYLYTLKQRFYKNIVRTTVVNRFKKNVSLHVETTFSNANIGTSVLWIALKKMYLYTLKQPPFFLLSFLYVVNRFKKNVSLHVETTIFSLFIRRTTLWIALKKMYLYTLKQQEFYNSNSGSVVNRFKKNVSLHVETTFCPCKISSTSCESL